MIKLKDILLENPIDYIDNDIDDIELLRRKDKYDTSVNEDMDYVPAKFSNPEAKSHMDDDVKKMSTLLGKASQQCIKIMMDGVKGGKYDALDIIRGIETGAWNRTHNGERTFMKMLWRKVRNGFRRYMPKGKLRKQIFISKEKNYG